MLPRSHSHAAARRRSGLGSQLCAVVAALLLLVSLAVLHSRLSSSSSPFPHSSSGDGVSNSSALVEDEDDGAAVLDPTVTITATTTTTATATATDSTTEGSSVSNPEDDPIDELDVLDEDSASGLGVADEVPASESASSLVWDHAVGVARLPFRLPAAGDPLPAGLPHLEPAHRIAAAAFGSDDEPVDLELRVEISSVAGVEDALLLKPASSAAETRLRAGWARWLEGKADYLRRDRMLRSNLEFLNPRNHPLLQDPDSPGLTSLTRGDRMVHRMLLAEIEKAASKKFERRSLQSSDSKQGMGITAKVQQRRWGYYPGIDSHLGFNEFMEKFFEHGKCSMKVFMVWNSPQWAYGVRHQRGLESLLRQHPEACVVMLSETLELEFFQEFVKEGYKVAVALPNLDELLEGTLTHDFVSVWNEWRKTKYYPLHYSELVRLAALYKYGGIYLDSDVVVLKPLNALRNSIGVVKQVSENSSFSGTVLAFEKNSSFLAECLKEFHSTYDDKLLQWNGAELMTRVIRNMSGKADENSGHLDMKFEPSIAFYPISSTDITRYFSEADSTDERAQHDALFSRIVNDSTTFHLWSSITSSLVEAEREKERSKTFMREWEGLRESHLLGFMDTSTLYCNMILI
uniref:Alpha 1,4-glycosyltransferase domain-containing protein n=1 Tax=Oryza punctata TaxID=4537 RepID=A0A0E0LMC7_ORYPU